MLPPRIHASPPRLVAGIKAATRSIHLASGHMRSREVAEALVATCLAAAGVRDRYYAYRWDFTYAASFEPNFESMGKAGKDEESSPR